MGSDLEDDEKLSEESPTKQNVAVDVHMSPTEASDETEKPSGGKSEKKRKRTKISSSDSQKPVVDANSSNIEVEEASETNSNGGPSPKKKRKSKTLSESEEQDEKERKPMLTDPALPSGWRRECVQRKTGKTEGLYDVYIFSPEGKKFRSRVELARFLVSMNLDLDPEDFDFSVYGRKGYASNSAIKKKIKSILEMHSSVSTPEKKDVETESVTPEPDKQSESGEVKRTPVRKGRKPKDKTVPTQPQKKARFKFTPTIKEIFKCARQNPFCLDCGKTDCKYPYVELRDIADCGMLTSREGQIIFISDSKEI